MVGAATGCSAQSMCHLSTYAEKMESLSGNYKTMEDPQKIDEEIEKLQKEFTDLKKEGDRYKTEVA